MSNKTVFHIEDENDIRLLVDDNGDVHSKIHIQEPQQPLLDYMPAMMLACETTPNPTSALILGMGGGSMLHYLHHHYPQLHITAIEVNPQVIQLAEQHFAIDSEQERVSIIQTDAFEFVKTTEQQYDLIFVDLFSSSQPANTLLDKAFYADCKSCLSKQGSIAFNSICHTEQDADYVMSEIHQLFPQRCISFPISGHLNLASVASNNRAFKKIITQLSRQGQITLQADTPSYGLIANHNN